MTKTTGNVLSIVDWRVDKVDLGDPGRAAFANEVYLPNDVRLEAGLPLPLMQIASEGLVKHLRPEMEQ